MDTPPTADRRRYVILAGAVVVALVVVFVFAYFSGRRAGGRATVVEGTAEVLANNQLIMDGSAGDTYPGGTGAFGVEGAWWTADGVTHRGDTPPSCVTPGSRPKVRLAVVHVRDGAAGDSDRWVVTHVDCLSS